MLRQTNTQRNSLTDGDWENEIKNDDKRNEESETEIDGQSVIETEILKQK